MTRNILIMLLAGGLAGCASTMSGLDGDSKFACKAPDGVTCASLSGVYANAVANNLPGSSMAGKKNESGNEATWAEAVRRIVGEAPSSGDPIRSMPKVLRVWIAPWEDTEGDLHDQSFIYVMTNPGRWVIEHNQKMIADRYRPTFAQGNQVKPDTQTAKPQPGQVVLPGAQMYGQGSSAQVELRNAAAQ